MVKVKYIPHVIAALANLFLLVIAALLFAGRKVIWLRPKLLIDFDPQFYQHISNFSISYLLFSGIGFIWLLIGVSYRYIIYAGILLAIINLVYELFIPLLNTPDLIDAYYGLVGTFIAFLFLTVCKYYGLKENPEFEN